ncbi:MAG: Rv0909 family putative TA system antitoxin [Actinomyces sp.]|uniref:Rv0909 family putative TA system antitoxin n=1 Tax=Actinomyces sp. TaxID=29317 RepID=UPI0026DAA86E|nr:Rv0909 family putative TA system antitoxin [Actinomyces sp.]MDO4244019.1 Rv0909 family putative TA system antitoxin [Actinomyces sp.]
MGLDDLKNKAEQALSSEKVESVSDTVLDKAADAAKKVTGGKFDSQVDAARDAADDKLGNA